MDLQPEICIMMPAKNAGLYLEECLNSIVNQSYYNWELIVVNDNSTDNTWQLLLNYAEQDQRIKVFKNEGNGIVDALNTAYPKSSGRLITRMDADDVMAKHKLETLRNTLIEVGDGHVITAKVKVFSALKVQEGFVNYQNWINALSETQQHFTEIYKECVVPSPCWMMFRSDFETIGAFKGAKYPEDYDLCFKWYAKGLKIIGVNEILHYWRDHDERASRTMEEYADNLFLELKCHYFFKLDVNRDKQLILWGAGKKAKKMARILLDKGERFTWICNNDNKVGKNIYGVTLKKIDEIKNWNKVQVIVLVAATAEQEDIERYLVERGGIQNEDFYLFC